MWFVGLDVHSATTAVSIRSSRGAVVLRTIVPTDAASLRRVLRGTRGRVKVACEAGTLAPWIKRTLETQSREVIVCDRRRTRLGAHGGSKSDRFDADRLSECLRNGSFHDIYVPSGAHLELRRYVLLYSAILRDRGRIKQRLKALFLELAIRVPVVRKAPLRLPLRKLSPAAREVARAHVSHLQNTEALLARVRTMLVEAAAKDPVFTLLQTIPYVGEIRAATLLGVVGTSERFRARRQFWAYCGLGVIQRSSSEHRVENGEIVRQVRHRGIRRSRAGQFLLKQVLSDMALHASSGHGELRLVFDRHIARGKPPAVARVALARKLASIIITVWRTGLPYESSLLVTH